MMNGAASDEGKHPFRERAKAKVNLTLHVKGRRPDGYHELESLVMFADLCDEVTFEPSAHDDLTMTGPFASAVDGHNLVFKARDAVARWLDVEIKGAFTLDKHIPVAAGLGGGSSDAAAAIRALLRFYAAEKALEGLPAPIAAKVGADVPVCLHQTAAWMWGLGENVAAAPVKCDLPALLVNPGVKLSTRDVFHALDAKACGTLDGRLSSFETSWTCAKTAAECLRDGRNDLETPAISLQPAVADVLKSLRQSEGCQLARLSGSGPTCFGLFQSHEHAYEAKSKLLSSHPQWWAAAVTLS